MEFPLNKVLIFTVISILIILVIDNTSMFATLPNSIHKKNWYYYDASEADTITANFINGKFTLKSENNGHTNWPLALCKNYSYSRKHQEINLKCPIGYPSTKRAKIEKINKNELIVSVEGKTYDFFSDKNVAYLVRVMKENKFTPESYEEFIKGNREEFTPITIDEIINNQTRKLVLTVTDTYNYDYALSLKELKRVEGKYKDAHIYLLNTDKYTADELSILQTKIHEFKPEKVVNMPVVYLMNQNKVEQRMEMICRLNFCNYTNAFSDFGYELKEALN